MTTSDELKVNIITNIEQILYILSNPTTTNSFIINEKQFEELKLRIKNKIETLQENSKYTIQYYLSPIPPYSDLKYNIGFNILENDELLENFILPFSIQITKQKLFYYCDIQDLTIQDFLENNGYTDEVPYFIQQFANLETEYMLGEQWLCFTQPFTKHQREYYQTLTNDGKVIFAKSHGYTSAIHMINEPFSILFDCHDMDTVNSLFDKIEFKY